jgi:hypothetical protein
MPIPQMRVKVIDGDGRAAVRVRLADGEHIPQMTVAEAGEGERAQMTVRIAQEGERAQWTVAGLAVCVGFTIAGSESWDTFVDGSITDATGFVFTTDVDCGISYWDGAAWQYIGILAAATPYTSTHTRIKVADTSHGATATVEVCPP